MSEDASFSQYPSYGERNVRKSHFVAIFFIILFVVIFILVGLYFLGASKKGTFNPITTTKPTVTPAPSVSGSPTNTPTPAKLNRSDLVIAVLNGSGVVGAAKEISSHLEDLEYTVETVGNAKRFDYKGVTILVKEEKQAYADLLKKDLSGKADPIVITVDDNLTVDAEVIVGK